MDDPDTADAVDGSDIGAVELTQAELAGPPQVGNTAHPPSPAASGWARRLHTEGGTWEPQGVSLSYQWLRNGVPIPGATSASYTLTPDDYQRSFYGSSQRKRVSVRVTAAAAGHRDGVMVSDDTAEVKKGFLVMSGRPTGDRQAQGRLGPPGLASHGRHLAASAARRDLIEWFLDDRRSSRPTTTGGWFSSHACEASG